MSTGQTPRLTVRDYPAYDNHFDGLAGHRSQDSYFSRLNLQDNLAAAISPDVGFNHNVLEGAALTGKDLDVFIMWYSRDYVFKEP